jgi:chromate reductase
MPAPPQHNRHHVEDSLVELLGMTSTTQPDLLVLTASNGENLKLARRFVTQAQGLRHTVDLLDLTTLDLPLFTPRAQAESTPAAIGPLQQQLMAAPRWVICAPEYNGSIPPSLTNAIAWLSVQGDDFRALFNGRPIAMATFSGGGGMELLVSLRIQLTHLGAQVVGRQLLSNYAKPAKDESIDDLLQRLLQMTPLQL